MKVLVVVLLLSFVSMLVCPVISVTEEEQKTTVKWFKWHDPGVTYDWWNYAPPNEDYLKFFGKGDCNVNYYRLNVGGERALIYIPEIGAWTYGIVGGTTYRLFIDFNYEGRLSSKTEYYKNEHMKSNTVSIIGTYTFEPESPNHDIDGTIKFHSCSTRTYVPTETGYVIELTCKMSGHGTGDLEGVVIEAEEGRWIYDSEFGPFPSGFFSYGVYEGTVKGWPT